MMSKTKIQVRLARPRRAALGRWLACAALARCLAGCLPSDLRPTPGTVHVTAEPSREITDGVVTADGWHISFERFLAGFEAFVVYDTFLGSHCESYSDSSYVRLLDFAVAGPKKLADAYALGDRCQLSVGVLNPDSNAVLSKEVTESDRAFMLEPSADAYGLGEILSDPGFGVRPAVYMRGQASQGGVIKRFEWAFGGFLGSHACEFDLRSGDVRSVNIVFHGERIFRGGLEPEAPLRFNALANADADQDQVITLKELSAAPPDQLNVTLPDFIFSQLELEALQQDGEEPPPPQEDGYLPVVPSCILQ